MVVYECEKCKAIFMNLGHFQNHIASSNACEINMKKINECNECESKFTTKGALTLHKKKKHDNINELEQDNKKLKEELEKTKERIKILEKEKRKPGRPKKVINLNNSGKIETVNIVEKQKINKTNNVIINFGQEDISMLTNKEKEKILNKAWSSIVELIKVLHCNEKRPETRNICLTNLRSNDIYVYENGKFRTKNKEETINDLIQVRAGDIQEILEEYEGEMKEKTRKALMNLLDLINDKDEEQLKKTNQDVSRLLYDENKKINKE